MATAPQVVQNFGRNLRFTPAAIFTPASEDELLQILANCRGQRIRAVGRLHSWSEAVLADEVLVDLRHLNSVAIEQRDGEVWATVGGGCQIKRALAELDRLAGVTLPTLGLITEQTLAGASATGTHGSGRHSLSHYLAEVRIACYDADGQPVVRTISSGPDLQAARCSLGCLGIVVSVKFRCPPQYRIEEHFREFEQLDEVLAAEQEFPLQQFYLLPWRWRWMAQHRRESAAPRSWLAGLYRLYWFLVIDLGLHLALLLLVRCLRAASLVRAFYRWLVPVAILRGWRVVDRSQDMLVMEHELFRHMELEIFVQRTRLAEATDFVREVLRHCAGETEPLSSATQEQLCKLGQSDELPGLAGRYVHHYPICIRKVLPDDTLLSMSSGEQGSEAWYAISLISYARPHERAGFLACTRFLAKSMAVLFAGRPHWGKHCPLGAPDVRTLYPHLSEFTAICQQHDPAGRFRNGWIDQLLFATATGSSDSSGWPVG
jgi:FAD/FMN-containing dehydrogenase